MLNCFRHVIEIYVLRQNSFSAYNNSYNSKIFQIKSEHKQNQYYSTNINMTGKKGLLKQNLNWQHEYNAVIVSALLNLECLYDY